MIGFALLAGAGMVLLAGVVLLPAYVSLAEAEHALACEKARRDTENARLIATGKLLADRDNPVLLRRIIAAQTGRDDPTDPEAVPQTQPVLPLIHSARYPLPEPPDNTLLRVGRRLRRPALRRGVFLFGFGLVVLGLLMFSPPRIPVATPAASDSRRR